MDRATPTDKDHADANAGFIAQLLGLTRATFAGRVGRTVMGLMAAAFVVIGGTAYVQIRMNSWYKPFYDALSRRDLHDFTVQLGVFFILAAWLTVLNVCQRWVGGHWSAPRAGYRWEPHRWEHRSDGWHMHGGGWVRR